MLDNANREDLNYLKENWQSLIDHVKQNDRALVSLLQNSEPVAASSTHVLIKFEEDIHCELVNKGDDKREQIESIVYTIINKKVKMVGVPDSQWLQVRHDYIKNKKQQTEAKSEPKNDIVKTAEDLFGKDTINLID